MAGSSATLTSREVVQFNFGSISKRMDKLTIDWVADSAAATVPTLALDFAARPGYLIQAVTNPGATAPTDNYDITLVHAEGGDLAAGGLVDRDTANSEVKVFDPAPFLEGTVTFTLANNAVNSATGRLILYVTDER